MGELQQDLGYSFFSKKMLKYFLPMNIRNTSKSFL